MTQEKIDKVFEWNLGLQLLSIFSTSDDRLFIRKSEALQHTNDMINSNPQELVDTTIIEWFPSN